MPSAMENKGEPPEMSEAHLLAPWHATGKLDETEARELEALAKEDPEFARLLVEVKGEAEAAVFVNEALGKPPKAVWERLERSIAQEKRQRSRWPLARFFEAIRESVSGFLEGFTKPQWQAAAAAAVAICAIQAGAIIYLARSGELPKFVVASGPSAPARAKPAAFIVSFSPNATIGEISAVLDNAGAIIVEGPNSDMIYHVGLRDDNADAKDRAYKQLQASEVVKLIFPEN